MAYIGKQPVVGNFQVCDAISVVNGQAAYTMQVGSANVEPENANHMLVSLNGILQKPGSSFTISGATITFASNLATGDVIDFIILLGDTLNIGTPSDGAVVTASIADNAVTAAKLASGAGGKIGQVVSTTKTDTFSTTSDSFTDITGLSVAITPSASGSKVLVLVNLGSFVNSHTDGYRRAVGRILRGSTDIASGDAATGVEATFVNCLRSQSGTDHQAGVSMNFLDSPSTTSETTYKVQAGRGGDSNGTVFLNRSGSQDSSAANTVSTITVMEVLA